ncbi:hypothetical protein HDU93_008606 [Gonapodya sp. JEL0774]|nr:hypothetical protein HDU93_008606 [Gonapodya sp. JEL0774]
MGSRARNNSLSPDRLNALKTEDLGGRFKRVRTTPSPDTARRPEQRDTSVEEKDRPPAKRHRGWKERGSSPPGIVESFEERNGSGAGPSGSRERPPTDPHSRRNELEDEDSLGNSSMRRAVASVLTRRGGGRMSSPDLAYDGRALRDRGGGQSYVKREGMEQNVEENIPLANSARVTDFARIDDQQQDASEDSDVIMEDWERHLDPTIRVSDNEVSHSARIDQDRQLPRLEHDRPVAGERRHASPRPHRPDSAVSRGTGRPSSTNAIPLGQPRTHRPNSAIPPPDVSSKSGLGVSPSQKLSPRAKKNASPPPRRYGTLSSSQPEPTLLGPSTNPSDAFLPAEQSGSIYTENELSKVFDFAAAEKSRHGQKWFTNPKSCISNIFLQKNVGSPPPYEFRPLGRYVRCTIQFQMEDVKRSSGNEIPQSELKILGTGDATSKKEAEKIAALHACLLMWKRGFLDRVYNRTLQLAVDRSGLDDRMRERLLESEDKMVIDSDEGRHRGGQPSHLQEVEAQNQQGQHLQLRSNQGAAGQSTPPQQPQTPDTMDDKFADKKHILAYCARFDFEPTFDLRMITVAPPGQSFRARRGVAQGWLCEILFPAQKIAAEGRGNNKRDAEKDAYKRFKAAVDDKFGTGYFEQCANEILRPQPREPGTKTAKQINRERVEEAQRFMLWFTRSILKLPPGPKGEDPYRVEVRAADSRSAQLMRAKWQGGNAWTAVVLVGGRDFSSAVGVRKKDAKESALVEAMMKARGDPEIDRQWSIVGSAPNAETRLFSKDHVLTMVPMGLNSFQIDRIMETVDLVRRSRAYELMLQYNESRKSSIRPDTRKLTTSGPAPTRARLDAKSVQMLESLDAFGISRAHVKMREDRAKLPVARHSQHILDAVDACDVSVVVGATGSGKTTQVPQIILDSWIKQRKGAYCNIIVTQPRRIAAISVAQRVAAERGEKLGRSTGYQVRFESVSPERHGSILFCTTGILLRKMHEAGLGLEDGSAELQNDGAATANSDADNVFNEITHVVVDECHERDMNIDFLLVVLKKVWKERRKRGLPAIKLVLMSATIQADLFAKYFEEADIIGDRLKRGGVPIVEVPGRTFPVRYHYLEDIVSTLRKEYPERVAPHLYNLDTRRYLDREYRLEGIVAEDERRGLMPAAPVPNREPRNSGNVRKQKGYDDASSDDDESESDSELGDDKNFDDLSAWGVNRARTATRNPAYDEGADEVPYGILATTIVHICRSAKDSGGILCFLPGWEEITKLHRFLTADSSALFRETFANPQTFKIYLLHSTIPVVQQQAVFETLPASCRKIILSTNIAETSLTIPDIVYVVDSSRVREKRYDPSRRMTDLVLSWVSQANAKQRAGRAGRVREGEYYTVISRTRWERVLNPYQIPEIARSDLQELALHIKALEIPMRDQWGKLDSIADVLEQALQPPDKVAVDEAIKNLKSLHALDRYENLTPLGRALAALPLEPTFGRMVLLGVLFKCLDPILTLAAGITNRDPFVYPPDTRDEVRKQKVWWTGGERSDHLVLLNVWREWVKKKTEVQQRYGTATGRAPDGADNMWVHTELKVWLETKSLGKITLLTIEKVRVHIYSILVKSGFVSDPAAPTFGGRRAFEIQHNPLDVLGGSELNRNSNNIPLIRALLYSAHYLNLTIRTDKKTWKTQKETCNMHPGTINAAKYEGDFLAHELTKLGPSNLFEHVNNVNINPKGTGTLYYYAEKVKTGMVFLRGTARIDPLDAVLFGDAKVSHTHSARSRMGHYYGDSSLACFIVDGWLRIGEKDDRIVAILEEWKEALGTCLEFFYRNPPGLQNGFRRTPSSPFRGDHRENSARIGQSDPRSHSTGDRDFIIDDGSDEDEDEIGIQDSAGESRERNRDYVQFKDSKMGRDLEWAFAERIVQDVANVIQNEFGSGEGSAREALGAAYDAYQVGSPVPRKNAELQLDVATRDEQRTRESPNMEVRRDNLPRRETDSWRPSKGGSVDNKDSRAGRSRSRSSEVQRSTVRGRDQRIRDTNGDSLRVAEADDRSQRDSRFHSPVRESPLSETLLDKSVSRRGDYWRPSDIVSARGVETVASRREHKSQTLGALKHPLPPKPT